MAAPRKYSPLTRRVIAELDAEGVGATEIARRLREGEAGIPPVEIARTSVREIARTERRRTAVPEGAFVIEPGWDYDEIFRRADEAGRGLKWVARGEDGEIGPAYPVLLTFGWIKELRAEGLSTLEIMERTGFGVTGSTAVGEYDTEERWRLSRLEQAVERDWFGPEYYMRERLAPAEEREQQREIAREIRRRLEAEASADVTS
jgi:hypothetical protein